MNEAILAREDNFILTAPLSSRWNIWLMSSYVKVTPTLRKFINDLLKQNSTFMNFYNTWTYQCKKIR